ncbi:MAG TPA: hypothetical protein VFM18_02950 [Methanosarcina sp.]|nr:hypothetical protein [Methanosarcina sp.]
MSMKSTLENFIGKKIQSVEVFVSYDGLETSFELTFEDGDKLSVGSQSFHDGSSSVCID